MAAVGSLVIALLWYRGGYGWWGALSALVGMAAGGGIRDRLLKIFLERAGSFEIQSAGGVDGGGAVVGVVGDVHSVASGRVLSGWKA